MRRAVGINLYEFFYNVLQYLFFALDMHCSNMFYKFNLGRLDVLGQTGGNIGRLDVGRSKNPQSNFVSMQLQLHEC